MSRITIHPDVIRLLVSSQFFNLMAQTLDNSYLDHRHWLALQQTNPNLNLNSNFRVVGGAVVSTACGSSTSVRTLRDPVRSGSVHRISPGLGHHPRQVVAEAWRHDSVGSGDRARGRSRLRACHRHGTWTGYSRTTRAGGRARRVHRPNAGAEGPHSNPGDSGRQGRTRRTDLGSRGPVRMRAGLVSGRAETQLSRAVRARHGLGVGRKRAQHG